MRLSATTIESFRLWRDPNQFWMSESDLIATIKGVGFYPPLGVKLGLAFGKILETPDKYRVPGGYRTKRWPYYEQDDNGRRVERWASFYFSDETMAEPLSMMDRRGVFEAKAEKQYPTPHGLCTVVSKADQLLGADLLEFKTTLGTFDAERYASSFQFRFMLDAFEALRATYLVFCLGDDTPKNATSEVTGRLRSIERLPLYPYPELHNDCAQLVRDFADYLVRRGLDGELRERQARVDAGLPAYEQRKDSEAA